jgi:hypothetical protein
VESDNQIKFRSEEINSALLPSAHTWKHEPNPPLASTELHDLIIPYLKSINININITDPHSTSNLLDLTIMGNTWSRAARRKAKLQQPTEGNPEGLIRVTLDLSDGKVEMKWKYGKDRADIESFWNSMLAKTGLIKRAGEKRGADTSQDVEGSRKEMKIGLDGPA